MLYVTGDTHFPLDAGRMFKGRRGFPISSLNRTDYLVVLGDFGLFWSEEKSHEHIRRVEKLPYTVLFLDGNHENFDWIGEFPVTEKFGGKAQKCAENVYHLMRGEIYTICEKRIFVCGGAASVDKEYRIPYISWWPKENISKAEEDNALENIRTNEFPIDLVFTHTCPESIITKMFPKTSASHYDPTARFLDAVAERLPSTPWYFGHWHEDKQFGRFYCLYKRIVKLA